MATLASRGFQTKSMALAVIAALLLIICPGCNSKGRTRPIGFIRLGSAAELAQSEERYFPEARVLLRHDKGGFSAMSTVCTYDLSPLTHIQGQGDRAWISSYTSSSYDDHGHVTNGPAKASLPYYYLRLAPGIYGGAADTLYVEIGVERSEDWRLEF